MMTTSPLVEFKKAWSKKLEGMGIPSGKAEDWRYTSLKDIVWTKEEVKQSTPSFEHPLAKLGKEEDALFIVDGKSGETKLILSDEKLSKSLKISSISKFIESNPKNADTFAKDFFALESDYVSVFTCSKFNTGAWVEIADGVKVQKTIRILYLADSKENSVFLSRFKFGKNSNAKIVEEFAGDDLSPVSLCAARTHVELENGAILSHSVLGGLPHAHQFFHRLGYQLESNSHLSSQSLLWGGTKTQQRIETAFVGEGAELQMKVGGKAKGSQHFDFWIRTHHTSPNTKSALNAYSIVEDSSRVVINANLLIPETGKGTDANQRSKCLLLSPSACVDTIPKLEISCDDVKVAHGASVSEIQPEELYYLESRGIPREEAKKMILSGFMEELIQSLPTEELKNRIRKEWGGFDADEIY